MRAILAAMLIAGLPMTAQAAGAIAIGQCSRVGAAVDLPSVPVAAARALAQCESRGDRTCKVVINLNRSCGAFAIDGGGGCHARGWAFAGNRQAAEAVALAECRKNGGQKCRIQNVACDNGP